MAIVKLISKREYEEGGPEGCVILDQVGGARCTDPIHHYLCPHYSDKSTPEPLQDDCNEWCKERGKFYQKTTYEGLVVGKGEINGYNDSDFYAEVWNTATEKVERTTYGTTRAWTYGNFANVDAPIEIMGRAHIHEMALVYCRWLNETELKASVAEMGREVTIMSGRRKGTSGKVTWRGRSNYGYMTHRVKITTECGTDIFIDSKRVQTRHLVKEIQSYGEFNFGQASRFYKPDVLAVESFAAIIKKKGIEMHQEDDNLERLEARIKEARK